MAKPSEKIFCQSTPLQIGLIRTSAIGDAVLITASLQLILSSCPKATVHIFSKGGPFSLLRDSFLLMDRVKVHDVENDTALNEIPNLDLFFDYQANLRSRLISKKFRRTGTKCFVLKKDSLMRGLLVLKSLLKPRQPQNPRQNPVNPQGVRKFEQMKNFTVISLQKAGLKVAAGSFQTYLPNCVEPEASILEQLKEPYLAIAPGASYEAKRAPTEVLARILKGLPPHYRLVYLGDGSDRPAAQKLMGMLGQDFGQVNLCGMLSLSQSSFVLKQANGLIGNDSALTHMAEAVKTPSAVLFGPTSEAFGFAPFLKESGAFSVSLGCRPCSKHGRTACRFQDQLCFSAISPELVSKKVRRWKKE